ncbi:MAG: 6,7-dimethyl-8-ribityllumazine synthase [Chloroflexi bacterium]|nr:6,7-dimethyl-8-ribityllumazine synthase [Chloroflexota bacterium]MDA1145356.1 6,7-dimethyl-8-ribityllumazine synthase [Chloroflexota bacterium]
MSNATTFAASDVAIADALGTKRIAFIQATWHREIVDQARDAFLEELARQGVPSEAVDLFEVPGSLEIPLQTQLLCRTGRYAAVVAAGLIVDGGIYRHEFVAATVLDAMMKVQLETVVPVLSAVLTPQRFHEHQEHLTFFREHFTVKGAEVAVACVATIRNLQRVRDLVV